MSRARAWHYVQETDQQTRLDLLLAHGFELYGWYRCERGGVVFMIWVDPLRTHVFRREPYRAPPRRRMDWAAVHRRNQARRHNPT